MSSPTSTGLKPITHTKSRQIWLANIFFVVWSVMAFIPLKVYAQQQNSYTFSGVVTYGGSPLPSAMVQLSNSNRIWSRVTNVRGEFVVPGSPGPWLLTVTPVGLPEKRVQTFVNYGESKHITIELSPTSN